MSADDYYACWRINTLTAWSLSCVYFWWRDHIICVWVCFFRRTLLFICTISGHFGDRMMSVQDDMCTGWCVYRMMCVHDDVCTVIWRNNQCHWLLISNYSKSYDHTSVLQYCDTTFEKPCEILIYLQLWSGIIECQNKKRLHMVFFCYNAMVKHMQLPSLCELFANPFFITIREITWID